MLYRDVLLRREGPEWWLTPTTIVGFRRLLEGFSPPFGWADEPREEAPLTWPLTPQPQTTAAKIQWWDARSEPHFAEEC